MKLKNKFKIIEKNKITDTVINIKKNIMNNIVEAFIQNYSNIKNEKDFEEYFFELLKKIIALFLNDEGNNFQINFQKNKKISDYIESCIKLYIQITNNLIKEILDNKSLEFLDLQVYVEQMKNASINSKNKKNRNDLKQLITLFLKDNFYFLAQKYLIYKYINNLFEDFIEIIEKITLEKIDNILENDYDINNDYQKIYLKIFEEFEKNVDSYRDENKQIYA